jgi:hypothetical protein
MHRHARLKPTADPHTYAGAKARPDAADWELACDNEKRTFECMGAGFVHHEDASHIVLDVDDIRNDGT